MTLRFRVDVGGGGTTTSEVGGDALSLGRDPGCEIPIDAVAFPQVSWLHAQIAPTAGGISLVPKSKNNKTLLNDVPVEDSAPIEVGDCIRLGFSGPRITILGIEARATPPAPEPV